ncbi:MAG: hypothetical protein IJX33_02440, partial [Akkermansia sp.]|nr:hypothetical protein [Akkermansia sp.]
QVVSQWNHFSAAPGASESHTWKIASPGRQTSGTRFSFGQPRSGVRGRAYHKARFTSSVFLRKSFQNTATPALSTPISCRLERKIIFETIESRLTKAILSQFILPEAKIP